MAERRISLRVPLVFCLILGVLHSTQSNNLDERCIKRYSASYKQNATQLEISGEPTMYPANNAIDGNSSTCSKTSVSKNEDPWWNLDLGKQVKVSAIRIQNSWKHPTTISIQVLVKKDEGGFQCGVSHIFEGGETRIIQCGLSIAGSLVKIVGKKEQEYLALCEVDVFDETVEITEGVNYKAWFNLTLDEYDSLNFLNNKKPHSQGVFSTFQAARNISNYYGIKMTTYYSAPETGNYTFNMSGDNKSALYIRDVSRGAQSTKKIARIPRNEDAPPFTEFDRWNESTSKPQALEKHEVYELVAIMTEALGEDHLRVGVVLPNGEFEGPMKHRIFTSESAARGRIRHVCSRSEKTTTDGNVPSVGVSKTESAITEGIRQLQRGGLDNRTKLQMLDELEQLGLVRARSLTLGNKTFASFISRVDNFVFAAIAFNLNKFRGFNFPGSLENASLFKDGSITLPDTIFGSTKGRASVVIMTFKPVKEMIKRTGSDKNLLGSDVISATIEPQTTGNLTKPVRLVFRNTKDANNSERHCVFWVEDNKYLSDGKFGQWSKKGCSLVHKNDTHTTCQCNHLTKFALLFPVEEGSSEEEEKLELITYVGLSLSSAGCFITFAVYLFLRITRSLKTIVHLNLVLALGLADIVFLFGNLAENHKNVCFACTVLTFYLYLAVFAWMLLEGVHLYFLVIRVFGSDDTRRKKYYNLVGWGIPLIIVIITTGMLRYELVAQKHCWLSTENGAVWAFIAPALFVIIINTLILGAVLRTTMTVLRKDPGYRKEKSALRTVAMLVPILGITWVFGVMTFANDSIVFQYIFAACNAFQGFFIFILYCLFNTEVRHVYERKKKAWKTEREIESKRSKQNNSLDMLEQQPRSSF